MLYFDFVLEFGRVDILEGICIDYLLGHQKLDHEIVKVVFIRRDVRWLGESDEERETVLINCSCSEVADRLFKIVIVFIVNDVQFEEILDFDLRVVYSRFWFVQSILTLRLDLDSWQ